MDQQDLDNTYGHLYKLFMMLTLITEDVVLDKNVTDKSSCNEYLQGQL